MCTKLLNRFCPFFDLRSSWFPGNAVRPTINPTMHLRPLLYRTTPCSRCIRMANARQTLTWMILLQAHFPSLMCSSTASTFWILLVVRVFLLPGLRSIFSRGHLKMTDTSFCSVIPWQLILRSVALLSLLPSQHFNISSFLLTSTHVLM